MTMLLTDEKERELYLGLGMLCLTKVFRSLETSTIPKKMQRKILNELSIELNRCSLDRKIVPKFKIDLLAMREFLK